MSGLKTLAAVLWILIKIALVGVWILLYEFDHMLAVRILSIGAVFKIIWNGTAKMFSVQPDVFLTIQIQPPKKGDSLECRKN